jgi:hypothetical protein
VWARNERIRLDHADGPSLAFESQPESKLAIFFATWVLNKNVIIPTINGSSGDDNTEVSRRA